MATLNVLVVDDEAGIRSGIERILRNFIVDYPFLEEEFSFQVTEAGSGEYAIELINNNTFDIALLDNKLPGIDGIEVLEYINTHSIDIAVMMITSYASLDLAVKATQNGAYNFVPKPFTPQELKAAMDSITKHLYLKRMTRQMSGNGGGQKARNQFISVLSHELKSPINAVEGYLKMIRERQIGDNLYDYDKMIDRSLERLNGMRGMIMDLLDLTKLESGKKTRVMKKVDIVEHAHKAIFSIEPLAHQRKVNILLSAPETLYMQADSSDIESIFNNLLSNAVKYNKENGQVTIGIKAEENTLEIVIEDTGIGMSEEDLSKLFNEFVRIKSEKTKGISGSGLGLSIVKKIIDEYNGNITVESKPDEGTTFRLRLPLNLRNL